MIILCCACEPSKSDRQDLTAHANEAVIGFSPGIHGVALNVQGEWPVPPAVTASLSRIEDILAEEVDDDFFWDAYTSMDGAAIVAFTAQDGGTVLLWPKWSKPGEFVRFDGFGGARFVGPVHVMLFGAGDDLLVDARSPETRYTIDSEPPPDIRIESDGAWLAVTKQGQCLQGNLSQATEGSNLFKGERVRFEERVSCAVPMVGDLALLCQFPAEHLELMGSDAPPADVLEPTTILIRVTTGERLATLPGSPSKVSLGTLWWSDAYIATGREGVMYVRLQRDGDVEITEMPEASGHPFAPSPSGKYFLQYVDSGVLGINKDIEMMRTPTAEADSSVAAELGDLSITIVGWIAWQDATDGRP